MDWDNEPTLTEFTKVFNEYAKEITNVDDPSGYIHSHKIVGGIEVVDVNPDSDDDYEIVGLDFQQLFGCGCLSGIAIRVKKVSR